MGAMMNGMAAHGGVVPVGVTYLVFSDYLRPVLRLAAMMGLPVPFVFSHDSIGIGRNGPTHQPVEYLASLRAIPNMLVLRPADAVEAAECWEIALRNRKGPSSLIFARQALPALRRDGAGENLSARGAYVLEEATGPRRVTLLATGSEVALAVEARRRLEAEGIPTAVVSMPSWELFERQDAAYRREILGPGTVRVGIEAAVRLGWDRYLGEEGGFVGMTGFGASGRSRPRPAFRVHAGAGGGGGEGAVVDDVRRGGATVSPLRAKSSGGVHTDAATERLRLGEGSPRIPAMVAAAPRARDMTWTDGGIDRIELADRITTGADLLFAFQRAEIFAGTQFA